MAGLSLTYPVNGVDACQCRGAFKTGAEGIFGKKQPAFPRWKMPTSRMARGHLQTGPVFADHPFHVPKRWTCSRINRCAQNCSRTALKMLTLLRCVARLPCGGAVGFLVLGVHV